MPAEFNKLGISFLYPDNWALDEEDALAGRRSVTVYSPGGAFWSVSVHPHSTHPLNMAKAAVDAMRAEYAGVEVEEAEEIIAGRETIGFDLSFYYLDLINSASVRSLRTDQATYTVFCQAEDHEFDQLQPVFLAITTSLLSNLKPAKGWDRQGHSSGDPR
jgi:hypothetical protein